MQCSNSHKSHLHVRYILEDECLIEFWIQILPVHLSLVFGLLIRQKIQLDKGICQPCRPIGRGQVRALNNLKTNKFGFIWDLFQYILVKNILNICFNISFCQGAFSIYIYHWGQVVGYQNVNNCKQGVCRWVVRPM